MKRANLRATPQHHGLFAARDASSTRRGAMHSRVGFAADLTQIRTSGRPTSYGVVCPEEARAKTRQRKKGHSVQREEPRSQGQRQKEARPKSLRRESARKTAPQ
jgi:hypothetical protein